VNFSALIAEAVLSARSDAMIAADKDGIIRCWNPGAHRVFGFSCDEVVGRSLNVIIPERQRHWHGFNRVMQKGQSRHGDNDVLAVPAVRRDGATISVEFTIVPVRDESARLLAIAAIVSDTSTRFEEMRTLKRQIAEATKPSS
jgi:PAS domain S-box-containing protein